MGNENLFHPPFLFPSGKKFRCVYLYFVVFNAGEDLEAAAKGGYGHVGFPVDDIFHKDLGSFGVYKAGLHNGGVAVFEGHYVVHLKFYNWDVVPFVCNCGVAESPEFASEGFASVFKVADIFPVPYNAHGVNFAEPYPE